MLRHKVSIVAYLARNPECPRGVFCLTDRYLLISNLEGLSGQLTRDMENEAVDFNELIVDFIRTLDNACPGETALNHAI